MTDASTFFPGQLFQNPDGTFSLDVTGHLHAQGLDLDAGQSTTPPSQDRIRWLRADGGVVADLTTESNQGALDITAYSLAPGDEAVLSLNARNQQGHRSAEVSIAQSGDDPPSFSQVVLASEGAGTGSGVFILMPPPTPQKTIIATDTGVSDFLQLATTAKRAAVFGRSTLTWAGATPTASVVVTHNLGRIPVGITFGAGVMSDGQAAAAVIARNPGLDTATQFTAFARISGNYYNPAAGTTCQFDWTVIG